MYLLSRPVALYLFDQFLHPFVVRTLPVDLAAGWTDVKFVEILLCKRLQTFKHDFLADGLQQMVAAQAAVERCDPANQVEAPDHLGQLLEGLKRAQAIPISNSLAHQQAAIPGEQDASFPCSDLGQFSIIVVIAIETIKSQHSQMRNQPPKMTIQYETRLCRTAVRDGMDLDLIMVLCDRGPCAFPAIDPNQPHLGVRHAQGFHQMLDRLLSPKWHHYHSVLLVLAKEILQSPEELEIRRAHEGDYIPFGIGLLSWPEILAAMAKNVV